MWRNGEGARRRATSANLHGWLAAQEKELRRRQQLLGIRRRIGCGAGI
ncbi:MULTISPECIES: hypothetical protein [Aphanothece]